MSGETNSKRTETKGQPANEVRSEGRSPRTRPRASRTSNPRPRHVPITIEAGPAAEVLPYEKQVVVATAPELAPRAIRTQAAYRQLIASGLNSSEAAGLIGFVAGLATNVTPWSMNQVNKLLFLQSLYRDSRWGEAERKPAE